MALADYDRRGHDQRSTDWRVDKSTCSIVWPVSTAPRLGHPARPLAVGLLTAGLARLAVFYLIVDLGERGGRGFFDNWLLTGAILVVAFTGTGALLAGVVAVIRHGERSLAVGLAIAFGLLVTVFDLGELVSPH